MTLRRAVIALLISGAAIATSLGSAVPAVAATAAPKAALTVAPTAGGVVKQGASVTLEVSITNSGTAPLPAGTITFGLDQSAAATASTLTDRLKDPVLADYNVGSMTSPVVPAGATSAPIRTKIAADRIAARTQNDPGAHLVSAQLTVSGESAAIGATVITSISSTFAAKASLDTVVPFTAPTTADGLVGASTLAALTSEPIADDSTDGDTTASPNETGAWTAELRAVQGTNATIALDPAVIASIRVLGSAAPATAVTFLDDLEALPNEFVLLPYADADLPLERAAGATKAVTPASFASVLNQENFLTSPTASPTPTVTPTASATPTATDAPTPTPTSTTPVLPTTAEILDWPEATTTIAWPGARQTTAADLKFLAASGYGSVLLSSSDVTDTAGRAAAGPQARIGSTATLISDATISGLLNTAVSANTTTSRAALAELLALLATNASAHTVTSVLATVSRSTADPDALSAVLGVLESQSWIDSSTIRELQATKTATSVKLRGGGATPAARIATAKPLIQQEAAGRRLLAAAAGAEPLISQQNLALLGTMSTAWKTDTSGWTAAAATASTLFQTTLKSVYFDPSSTVHYYGGSGSLKIYLQNKLPYPITVIMHGKASNGRLVVGGDQKVTIQASAPAQPKLPIRSISNGEVQVSVTLTTPAGVRVGTPANISIDVNAGWETLAAIIFFSLLALLFGTGIYRNLTRRKRIEKRTESA